MAGRPKRREYLKRLVAAGGVDWALGRIRNGEPVAAIAASIQIPRNFLSDQVNRDKRRIVEIRGKDRGGTGRVTPEQLEARIQRQMESVSTLDSMIAERELWIENLKAHRAQKIATIALWKEQFAKGAPLRPKGFGKPAPKKAKLADPTPADLASPPEPRWEEPAPTAELSSAAETPVESVPEPGIEPASPEEYSFSLRRWDRPNEAVRRVAVKPLSKPDEGPRMSATLLVEHGKTQRVPKARQIQVVRLDRD
jgi:hypothetical protein